MQRYPQTHGILSCLDPIEDMLILLECLTARDYVIDILCKRHGILRSDAVKRSSAIISHMKLAVSYFYQARDAQTELSFLPAYYGILNLIKTYILFGPHHAELSSQRWHGATYPVEAKDSRSLMTEVITLKSGGALPLFYKTIVGESWHSPLHLRMSDIYPYIPSVSTEYTLATGMETKIAVIKLSGQQNKDKSGFYCTAELQRKIGDSKAYTKNDFKALKGFRKDNTKPNLFIGHYLASNSKYSDLDYRDQFRPELIYSFDDHCITTPCSSRRLYMIEELPITLLFFHMSSVVRYKPEFLDKIRTSRHWPILASARKHCVLRMLMLAWSYYHKENVRIDHSKI